MANEAQGERRGPGEPRVAGAPALDFTNTVEGARGGVTHETLHAWSDLLGWARAAGLVDDATARRIARRAAERPAEARAAFRAALAVREAIFAVVAGAVRGATAPAAERALLDRARAEAARFLVLSPAEEGGYRLALAPGADAPAALLAPLVQDAVEVLTDPALLGRVRMCAGSNCTWLFLDPTRNRSRRWCEMKSCGNRAKARRHRARARGAAPADGAEVDA